MGQSQFVFPQRGRRISFPLGRRFLQLLAKFPFATSCAPDSLQTGVLQGVQGLHDTLWFLPLPSRWATAVGGFSGRLRRNRECRLLGDLGVPESTNMGRRRAGSEFPRSWLPADNGERRWWWVLGRNRVCLRADDDGLAEGGVKRGIGVSSELAPGGRRRSALVVGLGGQAAWTAKGGLGVSSEWVHGGRRPVGLEGTPNDLGADGGARPKNRQTFGLVFEEARAEVRQSVTPGRRNCPSTTGGAPNSGRP
jgi:hypothetical protein